MLKADHSRVNSSNILRRLWFVLARSWICCTRGEHRSQRSWFSYRNGWKRFRIGCWRISVWDPAVVGNKNRCDSNFCSSKRWRSSFCSVRKFRRRCYMNDKKRVRDIAYHCSNWSLFSFQLWRVFRKCQNQDVFLYNDIEAVISEGLLGSEHTPWLE